MSTPENPPAFPFAVTREQFPGITIRDYFAAKATNDDILEYTDEGFTREEAKFVYADKMLAARNRAGEEGR